MILSNISFLINKLLDSLKNYLDVFSINNAKKLVPYYNINLAIKLQLGKNPSYKPIYPLFFKELAVLKEFLEENLEKGFIRESKSPASALILFTSKKDSSLQLYINYKGLNAITLKN